MVRSPALLVGNRTKSHMASNCRTLVTVRGRRDYSPPQARSFILRTSGRLPTFHEVKHSGLCFGLSQRPPADSTAHAHAPVRYWRGTVLLRLWLPRLLYFLLPILLDLLFLLLSHLLLQELPSLIFFLFPHMPG